MGMSSDADSSTVGKPRISAFQFAPFYLISTSGEYQNDDFESGFVILEISQKSYKMLRFHT